jgi:hypothetical protein
MTEVGCAADVAKPRATRPVHDYRLSNAQRIDEPHHIADEIRQSVLVDRLRSVGLTVASHVDRDSTECGRISDHIQQSVSPLPSFGNPLDRSSPFRRPQAVSASASFGRLLRLPLSISVNWSTSFHFAERGLDDAAAPPHLPFANPP